MPFVMSAVGPVVIMRNLGRSSVTVPPKSAGGTGTLNVVGLTTLSISV